MHTKHLGVDVHFLASVLALLVDFILPGTVQQNLDTIAVFMRAFYKKVCKCTMKYIYIYTYRYKSFPIAVYFI